MLNRIIEGLDLSFDEAYDLFCSLLNEDELKIAAYLAALQTKGYTSEELAGFARAMRDNALKLNLGSVADTCGTGGDNSCTINVSTAVAILLSCFMRVAKHGNVSVTSKSGSANVLAVLGLKTDMMPDDAKNCIEKTNFTFLLAPLYHPALRKIMPVRKQLGIKTVFNILGPLANPASPDFQLIGVYSADLVEKVANSLKLIGIKKAIVVHGSGLDEINPSGETTIAEVSNAIEIYRVTPEDFGMERSKIKQCSSARESAERILKVFSGEKNDDANFILMNASVALYAAEIARDFIEGVEIAENAIAEEKVLRKIEEIRNVSKARLG
jgi:anthranilate phosphoribosyltransferase